MSQDGQTDFRTQTPVLLLALAVSSPVFWIVLAIALHSGSGLATSLLWAVASTLASFGSAYLFLYLRKRLTEANLRAEAAAKPGAPEPHR